MMKVRLFDLVRDMGVRPLPRSLTLTDLAEWVVRELPALVADDDRAAEAVAIASAWLAHQRQ